MSTTLAAELLQLIRWYGQCREDQDEEVATTATEIIELIVARLIDLP